MEAMKMRAAECPTDVTLMVKAPTEEEDQIVKCELTWSIGRLKMHLSTIFPCQPEDQKLIYSGQLMQDPFVLKDVLRLSDGQETHTLHLVYTPKPSADGVASHDGTSSSGLRRRNCKERSTTPITTDHPERDTLSTNTAGPGATVQFPVEALYSHPFMSATTVPNLTVYQQWYQQQYMQYVTQYMAYIASLQQQSPVGCPTAGGVQSQSTASHAAAAPAGPAEEVQRPQQQQPQRFPILVHEPERVERDWLDYVNSSCRIIFLLLMIYFYSSALRFMIVMCAILALFLYRYRRTIFQPVNQVEVDHPQQEVPPENQPDNGNNNPDNNNNNNLLLNRNETAATNPLERNPTTVLSFIRMFIGSFFASLLPEPALAP